MTYYSLYRKSPNFFNKYIVKKAKIPFNSEYNATFSPFIKRISTNNIIANQLGINIRSIYWQAIIISALLTGAGFLLVGNVIFLGLIASNIALFLFKRDYKFGVISSGLIGFIILGLTYFINRIVNNWKNILFSSVQSKLEYGTHIFIIATKNTNTF